MCTFDFVLKRSVIWNALVGFNETRMKPRCWRVMFWWNSWDDQGVDIYIVSLLTCSSSNRVTLIRAYFKGDAVERIRCEKCFCVLTTRARKETLGLYKYDDYHCVQIVCKDEDIFSMNFFAFNHFHFFLTHTMVIHILGNFFNHRFIPLSFYH